VAIGNEHGVAVGVQTGEGILGLVQVQLEGKRSMSAGDFIRGQRDFIGAQLPS
jgi:methionyl-tRNA formyltransferase